MSLHAQLSPEAQAELAAQKRNSTITSIIISILLLALLGLALWAISIAISGKDTEEIVSYNAGAEPTEEITKPELTSEVKSNPSSPSSSMSKVIATQTPSATSIPNPDIVVEEPNLSFGTGDDFGSGWGGDGDGDGNGSGGFGIPASMQKRCSKQDRLDRLAKEGGTPECEDAVVKALRWLQKQQDKNSGAWSRGGEPVAMTGLALLAYLGHCETPTSPEFGETVENAILYLVKVGMNNNGKLTKDPSDKHWPYEHAIATYAIAEAYTMCKEFNVTIPNLKEVVQQAGNHIVNHQHQSGSWDYGYDVSGQRGGDNSILAWHLQALKACKLTGLDCGNVKGAARDALDVLKESQRSDGSVPYTPGGARTTMTGAAALCWQQWGQGARSQTKKATKYCDKNVQFVYNGPSAELYSHYYYTQAMINRGGSEWTNYNKKFRDELLNSQNADGSWKSPGGGNKIDGVGTTYVGNGGYAAIYRTCLCTLMLEVYYRFLPSS